MLWLRISPQQTSSRNYLPPLGPEGAREEHRRWTVEMRRGLRAPRRNDDVAVSPTLVLGFGCGCTSNNRTPPRLWHYFPEPQKAPKAKTKTQEKRPGPGRNFGRGPADTTQQQEQPS